MKLLALAVALLLMSAADDAQGCRCVAQSLAHYFERADLVMFARVGARQPQGTIHRLTLAPMLPAYKGVHDGRSSYVTPADSAACGLAVAAGGVLLAFGERDSSVPNRFILHTCNGSREFGPDAADAAADFVDVPARHVVARLQALHATALLGAVARRAPMSGDAAARGLIGLLDLDAGAGLRVYRAPDAGAALLATIPGLDGLATREVAYEQAAAKVFAHLPGWYGVRLARQSRDGGTDFGWISAAHIRTYWPYDKLLIDRLTYLNASWIRYVWPDAGAGPVWRARESAVGERVEVPVVVHEARRLAGQLWLRIDILERSPCDGGTPRVVLSGWTPAYGADGEPAAWFHSRGC